MKTETKKIDSTKREIYISVEGEAVKQKFEDVFQKIGQEAKVSGFRVGHVPRDILEKNFSHHAHEQVLKELIPEFYSKAIEKEMLDVIDMPDISEVKLERGSLSFKAVVEVSPEINVKDYKGIKLEYKKTEVSLDEIKRSIDALKESRKLDSLDEGFAKSLGYPSLSDLEKSVEKQIFIQKQNQERQKMENEAIEAILKGLDFKVPQVLVNRQLEEMLRQARLDLAIKGVSRDKLEEEEKKIRQELMPEAGKQAKIYLVLAEIARKENIPLDEHMPRKVVELLLREAKWEEKN